MLTLMRNPGATRLVQPAGLNRRHPLRWHHGFALRLPRRLLIVTFGRGR